MENNEYQEATKRTWKPTSNIHFDMLYLAAGLASEAGEVVGLIKKHTMHGKVLSVNDVEEELGDTLWYASRLAGMLGLDLSHIMKVNIEKLDARHGDQDPDKFYTITDDS